jgi:hypothetical protein
MSTPYFNRDESIILTAHKVIFDAALSDVMLTSQRIILIDAGYAQFKPQIIPLTTIETVIPGEDAHGNPIVTLSLAASTPGGATTSKELVFSRQAGSERKQECDEWVKHLKEQIRLIRWKASATVKTPLDEDTDIIFDDSIVTGTENIPHSPTAPETSPAPRDAGLAPQPEDTASSRAAAITSPEEQPVVGSGTATETESSKIPLSSRFHPAPASPGKRSYSGIAAIIMVILAIAGIAIMYSGILPGTPPVPPVTTPLPITTAATMVPTTVAPPVPTTIVPEPTATPVVTPAPAPQPQIVIPGTGVWVRVQYAGNFTGQVGLVGGLHEVMGSGDRFYRIPTVDGMVVASIQKQDGSGDVLAVEVYKNGALARRGTVAVPKGIVDLHIDLKTV